MQIEKNKAARLARLIGSNRKLAKAVGVDPALITRWVKAGAVPPSYNRKIQEWLRAYIVGMPDLDAQHYLDVVASCLDPAVCPTCGHEIEDGRVL